MIGVVEEEQLPMSNNLKQRMNTKGRWIEKMDEGTLGVPIKHHWLDNDRKGVGNQNKYNSAHAHVTWEFKRDWVRIPSEMFLLFDDMHVKLSDCCRSLIPKKGMIKEEEARRIKGGNSGNLGWLRSLQEVYEQYPMNTLTNQGGIGNKSAHKQ